MTQQTSMAEETRLSFPIERDGTMAAPAEYAELRRHNPVARAVLSHGLPVWLITRYEDVRAALTDPRLSPDFRRPGCPWPGGRRAVPVGVATPLARKDPPEHTLYRTALIPDFTVQRVRTHRPLIERVVAGVLDQMEAMTPPVDLVQVLGLPAPCLVVCELLGVPYERHRFFQRRLAIILSGDSDPEELRRAALDMRGFLADLLALRRREPRDDILTKLARLQDEHGLADEDVCATAQSLLNAGEETTSDMVGLGTLLLLKHPDQLAALCREPGLWPAAVEEMLRYLTIVDLACTRVAIEDLEIGGQRIRAGEGVFVLIGSADYDEEVFTDPATFNIWRPGRPNMAFGHGIHHCLGNNLARLELEIIFAELFRRFPGLRLAVPQSELPFRSDGPSYGIHSIPVTW